MVLFFILIRVPYLAFTMIDEKINDQGFGTLLLKNVIFIMTIKSQGFTT
jgi:hypothetical protein